MKDEEEKEEPFCIDTWDPDDYLIGIVHIPAGFQSNNFLDINDPSNVIFLKKFIKKIIKHPEKQHSKTIPSKMYTSEVFNLSCDDHSCDSYVPIIGECSTGGHCMRQFQVKKFEIKAELKRTEDDVIEISEFDCSGDPSVSKRRRK